MNAAQAERLRQTLLDPTEAALVELHASSRAAVLVALHERDGKLWTVFTRRRDDLRHHAGQISFPGGREEPGDRDLIATALRETEEEIGLTASSVEILGALDPVSVRVSGFALYPFVGAVEPPARWTPAASEVEAVFELALAEVARSYAVQTIRRAERRILTPTFEAGGELLWGASARILTDLLLRMGLLRDG